MTKSKSSEAVQRHIEQLQNELGDWRATFPGRTPSEACQIMASWQKEVQELASKLEFVTKASFEASAVMAEENRLLRNDVERMDWIEANKVVNTLSRRMAVYFSSPILHDSMRSAVDEARKKP